MTRIILNRLTIVGLAALAAGGARQQPEIHVAAAVSLSEAMQDIAAAYEREHGVRVRVNVAASNVLARQIAAGAKVDVFISADAIQMDVVRRAGLVRRQVDLLVNSLAVLVAADSTVKLASAGDLNRPEIRRIAIGDPAGVPAGVYARQYLEKAGLWTQLESKIVPTASVRAALAALEAGNVDVAIVYSSDARIARTARVAYDSPPEPIVVYPAALISSAPEAERFFEYVRSPEADTVFLRHGFGVPPARPELVVRPKEDE